MNSAAPLALGEAHGNERIVLQISLGAESYEGGDELPATIERADATMYAQKRNRKKSLTPPNVLTIQQQQQASAPSSP